MTIENAASIKVRDHEANEAKLAAARAMLAALQEAVASPANMAIRTTTTHRNAVAAIKQAEAAGIK